MSLIDFLIKIMNDKCDFDIRTAKFAYVVQSIPSNQIKLNQTKLN